MIRRIRFLEPMTVPILANNRVIAPFGLEGGQPGNVIVIETPGGGGFGASA